MQEQKMNWTSTPPRVASIKSLRAVGYSPSAAACDIIDNSITAKANKVWLTSRVFPDQSSSFFAIADDGLGMNEAQLSQAMAAGSRDEVSGIQPGDLGRFGMGLKVASWSQGKRLTVWSKENGVSAVRQWDLDAIGHGSEWRLYHSPTRTADAENLDYLIQATGLADVSSGTIVMWSELDRMLEWDSTEDEDTVSAHDVMARKVSEIISSVGRVFHRFISGDTRLGSKVEVLHLRSDGSAWPIAPWDPFMQSRVNQSSFTQVLPSTVLMKGTPNEVLVSPFVLPHRDRLTGQQWMQLGAEQGMMTLQGFYVYREDRLISYGTWLDLDYVPDVHYKLARIALDLPNTSDAAWKINIAKSTVEIPEAVRERIRRIAIETRAAAAHVLSPARKVLTLPGKAKPPELPVWKAVREVKADRTFLTYRLNRKHPMLAELTEQSEVGKAAIKLIETSLPYQEIQMLGSDRMAPDLVNVLSHEEARAQLSTEAARRSKAHGESHCDFYEGILKQGIMPYASSEFETALGELMDEANCKGTK